MATLTCLNGGSKWPERSVKFWLKVRRKVTLTGEKHDGPGSLNLIHAVTSFFSQSLRAWLRIFQIKRAVMQVGWRVAEGRCQFRMNTDLG